MHRQILTTTLTLLAACIWLAGNAPAHADSPSAFVQKIEKAHGKDQWDQQPAIHADILLDYGGKRAALQGTMHLTPSMDRVRLDLDAGPSVVFDGQTVWLTPADANFPRARFHAITWPYFLAAAMKLSDPGVNVEEMPAQPLAGQPHAAARVTFDAGVGDSPDDWYVIYRDKADRLAAMAYIVTYGKDLEEAEKEPHVILFEDFQTTEGITLSTRWTLKNWSLEQGPFGDALGEARISNIRFDAPAADLFAKPADARELKLPK